MSISRAPDDLGKGGGDRVAPSRDLGEQPAAAEPRRMAAAAGGRAAIRAAMAERLRPGSSLQSRPIAKTRSWKVQTPPRPHL